MSPQETFVAAARKCLRVGRKSLSVPQSLNLAGMVLAVDLGLKPALLYDSNGAGSEQVQQYASALQCSQLVSKSILTLDFSGNTLVVNPLSVRRNLEQVLCGSSSNSSSVRVIDVRHSLEKPVISDGFTPELQSVTRELLLVLRACEQLTQAEKPLCVEEKCRGWNLCTVFGLLLGYPVTYWFDQTSSFENCLSMTPLMVTTATATWQTGSDDHRCCLFSFSVPAVLLTQTRSDLDSWRLHLQERFQRQSVFKDLVICQNTVTLPSVCL